MEIAPRTALVVVDVQQGFDDVGFWGPRNNPEAEKNIAALLDAWQRNGWPVVLVRHDSAEPGSPLRPGQAGNAFKEVVRQRIGQGSGPELLVTKKVNSAFYGTPDLDGWLREAGTRHLVIVGIQTNMCVETTARMAGNLGYQAIVALDATHTFAAAGPFGWALPADDLSRATAVSLHAGGFATVVHTADLLAAAG